MKKFIRYFLIVTTFFFLVGCTSGQTTINFPTISQMNAEEKLEWENKMSNFAPAGYTFLIQKETEILEGPILKEYPNEKPKTGLWFLTKTQSGKLGKVEREYLYTYESKTKTLLSKVALPNTEVYYDALPDKYEYLNKPSVGSTFVSSGLTRFGVNCVGCPVDSQGRGNTSAGVRIALDSVRQKDGTWKPGITYEGYYILATDKAIPHCTVVEVTNHGYKGMGLEPGVPFKAIVLDRGGAIKGARIDFFVGDENNLNVVRPVKSNKNFTVEILSFHRRVRNGANFYCVFD